MICIQQQRAQNGKRKIEARLASPMPGENPDPVLAGSNIHYEVSGRMQGIGAGGLGAMHLFARNIGLIDEIDDKLHLLKIHQPYHESDHVLAIAYNILAGGTCLEDLERLRNDNALLDALGARRIPDPTTAGDFTRRFTFEDMDTLWQVHDTVRQRVWRAQPDSFFEQAIVDMDGSIVQTCGECKEGMSMSFKGIWGYHPLLLTLANTGEALRIVNRPGNRPSHEGAFASTDDVLEMLKGAGFRKILLRGDTDFSQTAHLDRWTDDPRVNFVFGMDAMPNLKDLAENQPESTWKPFERRSKPQPKTAPRQKPENVKEQVVKENGYENKRLQSEQVSEIKYQPVKCRKPYRLVMIRKNISVSKGESVLFDDIEYRFYLTNDVTQSATAIVHSAHARCQQENVIEQLKNQVRALTAPVDNLDSNGAYMTMAALAWNLKAWFALSLPVTPGRWAKRHQETKIEVLKMEFKAFVNYFIRIPCQIIRTARKIVYRILGWNRWLSVFLRTVQAMRR